jgi:hypothetical protein
MGVKDINIHGDVYGAVNNEAEVHLNINKQGVHKDLDTEKFYAKWWFISLCTGLIMGIIIGLYLSILWGVISAFITFILVLMGNPKRRFFRIGLIFVGLSGTNLISSFISGSLVITENDILYGVIKFGKEPYPWISLAFIVLAGLSFYYDSKQT